jgi:hypothetical protein
MGGLLAADLAFQGLVWRGLREWTGETAPIGQLNVVMDRLGNLTRPQPQVDTVFPRTDEDLTPVNPYGVNVFLEDEVELAKRERQLQMIEAAGFGWIRQQFRWDDLEVSGRGNYTDTRNTSGVDQGIDARLKYDNIVSLAEKYNVRIIARLGSTPTWALSPENNKPGYAPPANFADFTGYAVRLAERYKGRIKHYQVWNEPNLYPEWGEAPPNPEAYTRLLCETYQALKAVDPSIKILSGALGPSNALTNRDLSDYVFLQRMYDAGAGKCFDILSVQGYGLRSPPTDPYTRSMIPNFNHILFIREMMVKNGDSAKPIWISEMAWNPVPNDPTIQDLDRFGRVTDEQAAQYAINAYEVIRTERPYVGVASYWFFKRASDAEKNQSWYYFRLVEPDFTERPVYIALKEYMKGRWVKR